MSTSPVRHYCTLFDQNYLVKGLTMIRSLARQSGAFRLFVLCMDRETLLILEQLAITGVELIRIEDFEDESLRQIKHERSKAEYCWTCTPCILDYVLKLAPDVDMVTYLDADLMFFSPPDAIYDEIAANSVAIIEHRFSAGFEHYAVNGRYNVQWVTIRNDSSGLETLAWWRERCLEWCSAVSDGERMGDQKYLDCWPTKFSNVHVVADIGAGVAPWNFATHSFSGAGDDVLVDDHRLIFYHYHGYRMLDDGGFTPMPMAYMQDRVIPYQVYEPYRFALWASLNEIRVVVPNFTCGMYRSSALESVTTGIGLPERNPALLPRLVRFMRRLVGKGQ